MAPKDSRLQQHAAYFRRLCPMLFTSEDRAYARLQELETIMFRLGANLRAKCVHDSPNGCELPRQLEKWNRVLGHIAVQLRERNSPGELAVVVFDQGSDYMGRTCRTTRSALLLHWLLTNHHCVTALRVESWGVLEYYLRLFCDGVAKCTRLRNLQLCTALPSVWGYRRLLEAMPSLPYLEEITCSAAEAGIEDNNTAILASVIATSTNLNRLAVERFFGWRSWDVWCEPPGMSSITAALRSNAVISDLCLDVSCLKEEEYHPFCQVLKENRLLKSLHLVVSTERYALRVAAVAGVVEGSRALISLQLTGFRARLSELWALATSISSAGVVEQLALVACYVNFDKQAEEYEGDSYSGVSVYMQPFFHMVRSSMSLRKLRLPLSFSTDNDREVLFHALDKKSSIEEVHFECSSDPCIIIRETGTGARRMIDSPAYYNPRWEGTYKWEEIPSFYMDVFKREPTGEVLRRFTKLRMFHHLSSLTVCKNDVEYSIKAEHAEILAQFLRDTKSLSEAEMDFFAKHAESLVLLDGLRHNTSIKVLVIENWCRSRRTAQLLAEVVCSSKRLRELRYNLVSQKLSVAFFSTLAKSIHNNCTILSLKTYRLTTATRYLDRIREVLARNEALPVRAARCVTARTIDKRGAEALESLGVDPTLVCKVQEMSPVSQKEAEDAIKRTLNELDDMDSFMRAAGVVRQSVVCEESPDGRPGLDALPFSVWLSLRRYLRVADIVD